MRGVDGRGEMPAPRRMTPRDAAVEAARSLTSAASETVAQTLVSRLLTGPLVRGP
jgi:hypothetical protein